MEDNPVKEIIEDEEGRPTIYVNGEPHAFPKGTNGWFIQKIAREKFPNADFGVPKPAAPVENLTRAARRTGARLLSAASDIKDELNRPEPSFLDEYVPEIAGAKAAGEALWDRKAELAPVALAVAGGMGLPMAAQGIRSAVLMGLPGMTMAETALSPFAASALSGLGSAVGYGVGVKASGVKDDDFYRNQIANALLPLAATGGGAGVLALARTLSGAALRNFAGAIMHGLGAVGTSAIVSRGADIVTGTKPNAIRTVLETVPAFLTAPTKRIMQSAMGPDDEKMLKLLSENGLSPEDVSTLFTTPRGSTRDVILRRGRGQGYTPGMVQQDADALTRKFREAFPRQTDEQIAAMGDKMVANAEFRRNMDLRERSPDEPLHLGGQENARILGPAQPEIPPEDVSAIVDRFAGREAKSFADSLSDVIGPQFRDAESKMTLHSAGKYANPGVRQLESARTLAGKAKEDAMRVAIGTVPPGSQMVDLTDLAARVRPLLGESKNGLTGVRGPGTNLRRPAQNIIDRAEPTLDPDVIIPPGETPKPEDMVPGEEALGIMMQWVSDLKAKGRDALAAKDWVAARDYRRLEFEVDDQIRQVIQEQGGKAGEDALEILSARNADYRDLRTLNDAAIQASERNNIDPVKFMEALSGPDAFNYLSLSRRDKIMRVADQMLNNPRLRLPGRLGNEPIPNLFTRTTLNDPAASEIAQEASMEDRFTRDILAGAKTKVELSPGDAVTLYDQKKLLGISDDTLRGLTPTNRAKIENIISSPVFRQSIQGKHAEDALNALSRGRTRKDLADIMQNPATTLPDKRVALTAFDPALENQAARNAVGENVRSSQEFVPEVLPREVVKASQMPPTGVVSLLDETGKVDLKNLGNFAEEFLARIAELPKETQAYFAQELSQLQRNWSTTSAVSGAAGIPTGPARVVAAMAGLAGTRGLPSLLGYLAANRWSPQAITRVGAIFDSVPSIARLFRPRKPEVKNDSTTRKN